MHRQSRNKWVRTKQNAVVSLWQECDSCAAIDGAHMTSADRQEVKSLCDKVLTILDRY